MYQVKRMKGFDSVMVLFSKHLDCFQFMTENILLFFPDFSKKGF